MFFLNRSSFLKSIAIIPIFYLGRYNRVFLKIISPAPIDVSLKVTERCNSKCITCNVWQKTAQYKPELSIGELEEIFHQLKEVNIKTIGLYGGEPLLRKDIGEVIKMAKKIIKGARVLVITNGLLLKSKAQELLDGEADFVCISLDGIGEVNDKIRGVPGYYQKIIEGIMELKRIDTMKKVKINIGTTLLPLNIHQIPQLINLARELDISWSFNLFNTTPYHFKNSNGSPRLKEIDEDLINESIEYMNWARKKYPRTLAGIDYTGLEFAKKYLKGEKPFFHCVLGYLRVYIDSYMNIYSGCWAMPSVGNLKNDGLRNILNSPQYKERLIKMYNLQCPYCTCGFLINWLIHNPFSGIKFLFKNIPLLKR